MSLHVTASVAPGARWPTTARVAVRIANAGEQPVKVVGRLAVGYRQSDGRELFAEVHPRGSDEVVSEETRLYDRDPPSPEDYATLQPGEAIETDFDLLRWYALPGPGSYDVEVFYEGDGPRTPRIEGAAQGVHGSGRFPLDLPEETWAG